MYLVRLPFQLFALSERVDRGASPGRGAFVEAIADQVLAAGVLIGTYSRGEPAATGSAEVVEVGTGASRPADDHPVTPDGRYLVVRDRVWRRANPHLPDDVRQSLVDRLMAARRAFGGALRKNDRTALGQARAEVDAAKIALGERGPVWWEDGEDLNRRLVRNTGYADWYAGLGRGSG